MSRATPATTGAGLASFGAPTRPDLPGRAVLRVLLVEDNPGDAELLVETLREAEPDGPAFSARCVTRLGEVRAVLAEWPADAVLLDLSLPDGRGLDSLASLRGMAPEVPVVVMTGLADDAVALRAVQAGAQDYLVKGRDEGGAVRRAVRYAVERQRLVRAARDATRARDEMLAVVSHDLRNPLGAIAMAAHALLDPGPQAEPVEHGRRMGELIKRSADWMRRLIGDLLDVSRLEAGTLPLYPEPLPVRSVMDTLATMHEQLAIGQQVTLELAVAPDLPPVHADADRLVQALGNLLGNAIKFTPAGGRITLAAEQAERVENGTPDICFRVTDTGCGIAPEHLSHIFDRFWQVREVRKGGAGLGLAIAKGIVEAHGGTVGVASTPGVGTTFTCTLPATPAGLPDEASWGR